MKKQVLPALMLLTFTSLSGNAQVSIDTTSAKNPQVKDAVNTNVETRQIYKRKGNLYFSWGYNRAAYSHSDIHFYGTDYDFTIYDVTASDEPTQEFITYIKPNTITVPQWNERIGYFLNDKNYISIGHEHLKYVMDRQATLLSGTITSGSHAGTYNNTEVLVGDEGENGVYQTSYVDSLPNGFVKAYENCDGLNDISFEFGHLEQLWISKNCKHALSFQGNIAAGMAVLDTDADILDHVTRHNNMPGKKKSFHLGGYSFSASLGLQFDFFQHFFILGKLKMGYFNLPSIRTSIDGGKADQHFKFIEPIVMVGYSHPIGRK